MENNLRSLLICTKINTLAYERFALIEARNIIMGLKPGPKPIAKSTGKPDQRRRDNKNTPGNTPGLKPSKSSKK